MGTVLMEDEVDDELQMTMLVSEVKHQLATGCLTLKDGLPFGKGEDCEMQYDVTLRDLTGKDVIDAELAAERVVDTRSGPQLVRSPAMVSFEILRRQIAKIGCINGPLPMALLRQLSEQDMERLLLAQRLKSSALVSQLSAESGRLDAVSGAD